MPPKSVPGARLTPPPDPIVPQDNSRAAKGITRCRRCHRELTHPDSRKRGIGPICMAKEIYEAPMEVADKITALEELYREVRETGESTGNIQDMIEALRSGKVPPAKVMEAEDPEPPARSPEPDVDDEDEMDPPVSPKYPQDPDKAEAWVRHVFEELFPARLPGYEARAPQIQMAVAVARGLANGEHVVSEAGTGTGKSLAYLVPSVDFARKAGRPVVVTTGTIALQEQVTGKDIPFLQRTLDVPFQAAIVKGKGNYLCLERLEAETKQASLYQDPEFTRIAEWARTTETGDKAELPYVPPVDVWSTVNVDDTCSKRDCEHYHRCFYFKARKQWAESDVLVCNHALYFSDLAIRGTSGGGQGILPQYSAVVFDEAHHIEPVASESFGIELSPFKVPAVLKDIRKLRHPDSPEQLLRQIEEANRVVFERPLLVQPPIEKVDMRRLPEITQEQLTAEVRHLKKLILDLDEALGDLKWIHSDDKSRQKCQKYRERMLRIDEALQGLLDDDPEYVRWIAVERREGKPPRASLNVSPISVAESLWMSIWQPAWATVSTSATISTNNNFTYFKRQVGLDLVQEKTVTELLVATPFDYATQARLYIPRGLPEPRPANEDAYQAAIIPEIRDVLAATGGRAFALFTSYRGLQAAYEALADELRRAGIVVMKQGDLPRTQLVQQFKETHAAGKSPVLFATGTFWEGIDIQGEALSCVIIDKIPFARPDDPVTLAKLDAIKTRGGNEFMEWSVPEACIKLKQGVGRLIRTRTDRGLVVILDPRLRTKPYGRVFLNSLPPMPEVAYPDAVAEFMKGGGAQ